MAQLQGKELTLGYEGREIVSGLNFAVNAGDYLCIVGENGSGKTTLMKAILGLHEPMKGEILYGDGLKAGEMGYLPQTRNFPRDFPASVWEIVLSGCQNRTGWRPFYSRAEKKLARENIERLGIDEFEHGCYRELSGGQQQRVLLARALCATRKILLLDEPITGLDPKVTAEMYSVIHDLNRRDGVTILMITHDMGGALHHASHILHIGKELFFGTREAYLASPQGRDYVSGGNPA